MAILIAYLVLLGIPCLVMSYIGFLYGRKTKFLLRATLIRAFAWSCIVCWSLTIFGGGHGGSLVPLPSVLALLASLAFAGGLENPIYPWTTPLIPILCFLYFAYFFENTKPNNT